MQIGLWDMRKNWLNFLGHPYTVSGKNWIQWTVDAVGAVVQLVEYQTRNQDVAGSTHSRSTASNLEQVANLLCA